MMASTGKMFNWGAIISKHLRGRIKQAQKSIPDEVPYFGMASYLLDVIVALCCY
jgi:hypothetical protein